MNGYAPKKKNIVGKGATSGGTLTFMDAVAHLYASIRGGESGIGGRFTGTVYR